MKENRTLIVLIVDNSGSIESIRGDMEGALDALIKDQKTVDGECFISYYPFDSKIIVEERKEMVVLKDFGKIRITPRGGTALYKSVCEVIDSVGVQLSKISEDKRPERVLVAIVTDGDENSSGAVTGDDVKKRVAHQESVYKWKFVYLGANQDAYNVSNTIGLSRSNSMNYSISKLGINNMMTGVSESIKSMRSATLSAYEKDGVVFSEAQRAAAAENPTESTKVVADKIGV